MRSNKAMIMSARAALWGNGEERSPEQWTVHPSVGGWLRDKVAMGRRVIILFHEESMGMTNLAEGDRQAIRDWLQQAFVRGYSEIPGDVVFLSDEADPAELWNHSRRCGLDLSRSVFVGTTKGEQQLAKDAGIGRFEWAEDYLATRIGVGRLCA